MTFVKEIKAGSREFCQNWLRYLLLFMGLSLFNQFIVIPLFRYITTFVLQASAIPFVSYQNVVTIITTHTVAFLILIIELLLLLVILYAQLAYLLHGVWDIKHQVFTWKNSFIQTWQNIKKNRLGTLFILMLYFLLVVPLADVIFRTPLLSKVQISEFILDYLTRTPILLAVLIAFYLAALILGARLVFALPIIVFDHLKSAQAVKRSWRLTAHYCWRTICWRIIVLAVLSAAVMTIFYLAMYCLQLLVDLLPGKCPLIVAIINLSLVQIISEVALVYVSVLGLSIILKALRQEKISQTGKTKKIILSTLVVFVLVMINAISTNYLYLTSVNAKAPVIISHRGVDDKNGVQNTLQSLRKTAKEKPDYVEIDVHETKDKKFIVIHDENLLKLTGVNKAPNDLTLRQLEKLTAKEDGYHAKLVSFDQYLEEAKRLHQKLLIEIKTTAKDSKKMLQRFNQKYGKTILKNAYQVQSLDYRVVEGLHLINPRLVVFYIQPYNFTYPQSVASGYSMEYSTLNSDFIWQAHLQDRPVYAWTVNDEKLMKKMMYQQVDGLITDRVDLAKKAIKSFQKDASYATRILNYIVVLHLSKNFESA
ncbi:glycerophosphodiester phosphodiesterase [Lactobacillus crispatus]|uniref:Glycerophosphodiester phosphodiesterase n=2 Tax=Lactobacillus crispatus TaxID=47770 RepID=A0A2M9WKQ6_9LACO|nr:glycerophosphodiester phosphodiesterase [Lactobacillus crispatus]MBW0437122.1 glycerophosphodiester phosphodiesterase [Lactobacillus crispatus]MBW0444669.1 glycerophosphodiester phosphodiesterase [Lactobacillus crispatus]MBW0455730.1 glycerophosphodiester phosphodiesterase [Lactobacillus crispatus]MDK6665616.1 glycerophosphodiester phosphodiesterase [Lactobacillus crispatus]MDK8611195.1 glycerophosphodiester phosphodiesterase [Lactobacillus crispatus]